MSTKLERLYKKAQLASLPVVFVEAMKRLDHDVVRGCQVYGNFYWIPLSSPMTIFELLATKKMQGQLKVLVWTSDAPRGYKTNTVESVLRSSGLRWEYLKYFYHWGLIGVETRLDPDGKTMDDATILNWKYVYLPDFWHPYIEGMLNSSADRHIDLDSLGQMLGMCVLELLREMRFSGKSTYRAMEYLIDHVDNHRKNGLIVPMPLEQVEEKFASSLSRKRFYEVFQRDIAKIEQLRFFQPNADGTISFNEDMVKAHKLVNTRANYLFQRYVRGYPLDEYGEPTEKT